MNAQKWAMGASLGAAVLMLVGKVGAAVVTGSDAIWSDAAESIVHIVATGIAAFSLWYGAQPADKQHPYGHGKIAFFSAGFEGALIFIAALSILALAIRSLVVGPEVQQLGVGIAITGGLGLVNLALGWTLIRVGRKHNALVLVANGQHVLTDMWTSAGVVVGVALVWWTGIVWLDPVVAILAGLHILYSGGQLMKQSFEGLMDSAEASDTALIVSCLDEAVRSGRIMSFHQLHHRRVDSELWIEVHLLMEGEQSLSEAHDRASVVEASVGELFEGVVHITSHLEPLDHHSAHPEGHPETDDPLTKKGHSAIATFSEFGEEP